jgi:hypothetical protein
MGISQTGESGGHTARAWCEKHKFTATINAGMKQIKKLTSATCVAGSISLTVVRINIKMSVHIKGFKLFRILPRLIVSSQSKKA